MPGQRIRLRNLAEKTMAGIANKNTKRTFGTYITLLAEGWPASAPEDEKLYPGLGDRWADEVLPSDLEAALKVVKDRALLGAHWKAEARKAAGRVPRTSDGLGAANNAVSAWRRLFSVAVKDRHLSKAFDPAQEVKKPSRPQSKRMALEPFQLEDLWKVVDNTGDDPELDRMICETIIVTGARREGLLNLTLRDLHSDTGDVTLDEKFGKVFPQPTPDWFIERLAEFARSRGAARPEDSVFRNRPIRGRAGGPMTSRRLDNLFQRLQASLPWADEEQVTAHTLRHHAITAIERVASGSVAKAFARHALTDVTDGYSKAREREVAEAVLYLYGGEHPLVSPNPRG